MMTDAELRTWAESARYHEMTRLVAEAVLRVLAERDVLRDRPDLSADRLPAMQRLADAQLQP